MKFKKKSKLSKDLVNSWPNGDTTCLLYNWFHSLVALLNGLWKDITLINWSPYKSKPPKSTSSLITMRYTEIHSRFKESDFSVTELIKPERWKTIGQQKKKQQKKTHHRSIHQNVITWTTNAMSSKTITLNCGLSNHSNSFSHCFLHSFLLLVAGSLIQLWMQLPSPTQAWMVSRISIGSHKSLIQK